MYVAYDDEGTFCTGTKRECLDSVVALVKDGELDGVYNRNDRNDIHRIFSGKWEDRDTIKYSGFTVEKAN